MGKIPKIRIVAGHNAGHLFLWGHPEITLSQGGCQKMTKEGGGKQKMMPIF